MCHSSLCFFLFYRDKKISSQFPAASSNLPGSKAAAIRRSQIYAAWEPLIAIRLHWRRHHHCRSASASLPPPPPPHCRPASASLTGAVKSLRSPNGRICCHLYIVSGAGRPYRSYRLMAGWEGGRAVEGGDKGREGERGGRDAEP